MQTSTNDIFYCERSNKIMIGKLMFTYNRVQYITHNKNIKGEQNFELLRTECC